MSRKIINFVKISNFVKMLLEFFSENPFNFRIHRISNNEDKFSYIHMSLSKY